MLQDQHALEKWQRAIGIDRALSQGWEHGAGSFLAGRHADAYVNEMLRVYREARTGPKVMGHIWHLIDNEKSLIKVALETLVYVYACNDLSKGERTKRNTLARRLGERAEYVLWLNHPAWGQSGAHIKNLKKATGNDLGMSVVMKRLRDKGLHKMRDYTPMSNSEKICLGTMLLEVLAASTNIIEIKMETVGMNRRSFTVCYTKKYWDFLLNWKRATRLMRSIHMPMIVPPKPWSSYDNGGYLTIETKVSKIPYERFPVLLSRAKDCVLGSINILQEQELQIDKEQLRLTQEIWDRGIPVGEVPSKQAMEEPDENDFFRRGLTSSDYWRAVQKYKADEKKDQIRSRLVNCFVAAEKIVDYEKMFYVWFMDTRGRMYPRGGQISYSGSDVFRSMIQFKRKAPMKDNESIFSWIIGDSAGMRKCPENRQQFLLEYHEEIAAIGRDPIAHISKWSTAKNPWKYVQLCREWANYMEDDSYQTGVVCQADQTTSGFGHVACLTRDETLARWSNVCGETAYDIYLGVCGAVKNNMTYRYEVEEDPKKKLIIRHWLDMETDRDLWKKCTMPYIYGRGHSSLVNTIYDWLYSETTHFLTEDGIRINDMAHVLASEVSQVLRDMAPGVRGLSQWLKYLGREMLKEGYRPQWATPNQMVVESWQPHLNNRRMTLDLAGRKILVSCWQEDESRKKVKSGIAADYVQSMEAAFLQQFVWHWSKITDYPIITVHDCFGTNLDSYNLMVEELCDQFGRFYVRDYVTELHATMEKTLKKKLKAPPLVGTLDPLTVGDNRALFG